MFIEYDSFITRSSGNFSVQDTLSRYRHFSPQGESWKLHTLDISFISKTFRKNKIFIRYKRQNRKF